MSIDFTVKNIDATDKEIVVALKEYGFQDEGKNSWFYANGSSYRGVWAYPGKHYVTFTTYAGRNGNDVGKQMDFAIKLAKNFGGRLYDPQTGRYTPIKLTKKDKIRNMERRLLR